MEELIEAMKRLFATNFQYYVKAQGFHVNVVGPDFTEFHKLFSEVYEDAQENIDTIAEQIRAIEGLAPFSIKRIQELGSIKDSNERPSALLMTKELLADTQIVVDHYEECHDLATQMKNYGLINFLEGRMDDHAKLMWKLRSTLE
jgi:starvation-inducible DNA-binding protein